MLSTRWSSCIAQQSVLPGFYLNRRTDVKGCPSVCIKGSTSANTLRSTIMLFPLRIDKKVAKGHSPSLQHRNKLLDNHVLLNMLFTLQLTLIDCRLSLSLSLSVFPSLFPTCTFSVHLFLPNRLLQAIAAPDLAPRLKSLCRSDLQRRLGRRGPRSTHLSAAISGILAPW